MTNKKQDYFECGRCDEIKHEKFSYCGECMKDIIAHWQKTWYDEQKATVKKALEMVDEKFGHLNTIRSDFKSIIKEMWGS